MRTYLCATVAMLLATASATADPAIRLRGAIDGKSVATIEVTGLDAALLARLAKAESAAAVLTVRVAGRTEAMLGSHRVADGMLAFEPRYPLAPGVRYEAVFDPVRLAGESGKTLRLEFGVPRARTTSTTVVRQVYPTTDRLPENQLKFYIHFSAPMSRGEAYERVQLLDASGKKIEFPFLTLGEELWDPSGARFTLFFDPGRIKRGLKPREEFGPPLEAGKSYTLLIDRGWEDGDGNSLKEGFRKTFRVGEPDDQQPDPKTWKLAPPSLGGRAPFAVIFPEPLDHGMLQRALWVTDATGQTIPGRIAVRERETIWEFTPEKPWAAGAHFLVADTSLEDLAGNSIAKPFEIDVFHPIQRRVETETIRLPFDVRAR